jgi:hypothetical protein
MNFVQVPPTKKRKLFGDQPSDEQQSNTSAEHQGEPPAGGQDGDADGSSMPQDPSERVKVLEKMVRTLVQEVDSLNKVNTLREQQEALDEDEEVGGKLSSAEKRAAYLELLRILTPNLTFPELRQVEVVEGGVQHFQAFVPKEDKCVMPFCDELLSHLEVLCKPTTSGKPRKDPMTLIDKFYVTMANVEKSVLSPRVVPSLLIPEVDKTKLQNSGASGSDIRLSQNSTAGQKEVDALKELKQASTLMRVANNQELGLQALNVVAKQVNDNLDLLTAAEGVPPQFLESYQAMQASMLSFLTVHQDLCQGNTNLAKLVLYQYVQAVKDRRHAWLTSSKLPTGLRNELLKLPIDILQPGADEPLALLNAKSVTLLKDYVDAKQQASITKALEDKPPSRPNQGGQGKNKRKRKPQRRLNWNDFSPAAQAAGWAGNPVNQQQPRPGNRAGRGGKQGGRGRGQPFSAATASAASK